MRNLASSKCEWTSNDTYHDLYDRAKTITERHVTNALYNEKEQLYLETDASDIGLDASLLQVRDGIQLSRNGALQNKVLWPIAFASKSLTYMETHHTRYEKKH